jgi:hypothetical protein
VLAVYVLHPNSPLRFSIAHHSAIVGTPGENDPSQVRIDYEGDLYHASNLVTFADRVERAAGRHTTNYPTVARAWVQADSLVRVGSWDDREGLVHVEMPDALAAWLDVETVPEQEFRATGVHYEQRRELRQALHSPNPAVRQLARQEARRLNITF